MNYRRTIFRKYLRGVSCVLLGAMMLCLCAHPAEASKKKSRGKSSKSSSKKPTGPTLPVPLKPENYPAEIGFRIRLYNAELSEINAIRKNDKKLAQARDEVLKIKKESFEVYSAFISSAGRDMDKIRKTVAAQGWYKGMPQIAFVASKGLPDDIETTRLKDGSRLKLIYNPVGYYIFEKGQLRSFEKAN